MARPGHRDKGAKADSIGEPSRQLVSLTARRQTSSAPVVPPVFVVDELKDKVMAGQIGDRNRKARKYP